MQKNIRHTMYIKNEDKRQNIQLKTDNDAKQAVLISLIIPKTAKEIEKETGMKTRTVQRVLKMLQNKGKIRTLRKAERRLRDWHPDRSVYAEDYWEEHKTDLRIPVYVSKINDPIEIRANIDNKMANIKSDSSKVLINIILGKYERLNPYYSDNEKLEKLSAILSKQHDEALLSNILDLCEKTRGSNPSDILGKLDKQLGRDVNGRLVYLFIKEALSEVQSKEIDEIINSFEELEKEDLKPAIGTLHNLVYRGGFSSYLKTNRTTIMDIALKLAEKGIETEVIDELLNL